MASIHFIISQRTLKTLSKGLRLEEAEDREGTNPALQKSLNATSLDLKYLPKAHALKACSPKTNLLLGEVVPLRGGASERVSGPWSQTLDEDCGTPAPSLLPGHDVSGFAPSCDPLPQTQKLCQQNWTETSKYCEPK